jgi:hypothetical protein
MNSRFLTRRKAAVRNDSFFAFWPWAVVTESGGKTIQKRTRQRKSDRSEKGLAGGAGGEFDNLDARCVDLRAREARVEESLPGGFHGLEMAQFVEE